MESRKNEFRNGFQRKQNKGQRERRKDAVKSVRIYGDSHARNLASKISESVSELQVFGMTKPGAKFNQATLGCRDDKVDIKIVSAGSNDIACNEANQMISELDHLLRENNDSEVIVVNFPHRYDLIENSCVNAEIRKTNKILKLMCSTLTNVTLIDIGKLERNHHTKHGQHLNGNCYTL